MEPRPHVSVVLSTHNRARRLEAALPPLLRQQAATPSHEVIIVDNNSTDDTRAVVARAMADAPGLRYLFEPRQGLAHARNAGLAAAHAPLVAFTDDDVQVADDWVSVIERTFRAHPDVECLGGRTTPEWPVMPPAWLTRLHWVGPLALQDYGDAPLYVDARNPRCLAGANFAFRRSVFDRVGLFDPAFPRAQDTELLLRLYRAGGRALYVPGMRVLAPVDPARLTKDYHRKWHLNVGRCNRRMGLEELSDPIEGLRKDVPPFARLFGVPLFAVRQFAGEFVRWLKMTASRRRPEAFLHETRLWSLTGYLLEDRMIRRRGAGASQRPAQSVTDAPATSLAGTATLIGEASTATLISEE